MKHLKLFEDFLHTTKELLAEAQIPRKANINLDRLYELQEKIKGLKAEMKQMDDEFKGFESQLKPIFDAMKMLDDKLADSADYIVKITRYGHTREDVQWKPVVDQAMERLDDAAKAIIEECIAANKRVTTVKHSFDVEKKGEVNEASVLSKIKAAVVAVIEKFKNKIAAKFSKIDSENEKLAKLLAKVK
jgi:septal ring factor EnvC (AmiA/AmiB activator)